MTFNPAFGVLIVIVIAVGGYIAWLYYQEEEEEEVNKRKPNHPKENEHELLCKMLCILDSSQDRLSGLDQKLHHLIQHAHHLEELIVAIGGSAADQEKINAILAKTAQSKTKLAQALEATPPASKE